MPPVLPDLILVVFTLIETSPEQLALNSIPEADQSRNSVPSTTSVLPCVLYFPSSSVISYVFVAADVEKEQVPINTQIQSKKISVFFHNSLLIFLYIRQGKTGDGSLS